MSAPVVLDRIGSGDLLNFVWATFEKADDVTKISSGADVRSLLVSLTSGALFFELGEINELEYPLNPEKSFNCN